MGILKKKITVNIRNEKKEVLEKYTELWDGIKIEIETINGGEENNYRKAYMKI